MLMLLVMYGIGAIVIKSFGVEYHSPKQKFYSVCLTAMKLLFIGLSLLMFLFI